MKITLTTDEVRKALLKAVEEKLEGANEAGQPDDEDNWFSVEAHGGKVDDVEEVEFTCSVC